MARKKNYIESEVLNKAMHLFWDNGYKNTSMQMLEKEMGINKFSIYASFGNKHALFLESLKSYKKKTSSMFEIFKNGTDGINDIKQFFYDSVAICKEEGNQKGCLFTSTYHEFSEAEDQLIHEQMNQFMKDLKNLFIQKLKTDNTKNEQQIIKEANFLLLAKHGLASASKVNSPEEIKDYIEMTFKNL